MTEKKFFYGHEVSSYGVENGRVDYRTFASCFDAVLNNGIIQATGDIGYWEQISGFVDNSDEIDFCTDMINEMFEQLSDAVDNAEFEEIKKIREASEYWENRKDELEREQNEPEEVFQYFIVSDNALQLLDEANEVVYYNDTLDMYVWGVTHYGTSWDYVLTSIEL